MSKRDVLGLLDRRELLELADRYELAVDDRRVKDQIVEALASSRKVDLTDALGGLSRDTLKGICRGLGLDDTGKEKAAIIERLTGAVSGPAQKAWATRRASGSNGKDTKPGRPEAPLVVPGSGGKLSREQLERYLWSAADILRGSIDSSDYKGYIFGLLFLKRLSDRFDEECEALRAEGHDADDPDEHEFFVPKRARWAEIQRTATNLGETLNKACAALEDQNGVALQGVLAGIDFNEEQKLGDTKQRDSVLTRLVQRFAEIDLRNRNLSEPDMLGRAYEYLIEKFADDAGKVGGEFYTPRKVVQLIVEILEPKEGMRVCDPTCGSGGMLIESAAYVARHGGDPKNLSLFGQEKNLGTWAICKMNMLLHGIKDARIEKGDTIRDPKLVNGGELMLFDRVIANPPFSLAGWGHEVASSDPWGRFRFGVPPKKKQGGDLAFVSHMVATLNTAGRLGVVLPNGVLFRADSEAMIRQGLVEEDLVEAVIGLPANLFNGATIPAVVLLLNRAKEPARKGRVLFVDASRDFGQGVAQNFLRESDVSTIVTLVRRFEDVPRQSYVASVAAVREQRFDLTVARYVSTAEDAPVLSVSDARGLVEAGERERTSAISALAEEVGRVDGRDPSTGESRDMPLGSVLRETHERAGDVRDLPVLSVTKTRGVMLAADRVKKKLHSANLSKYRVARRGQLVVDPMLLWDGAVGLVRVVDVGLVSPDYRVFAVAEGVDPDFLESVIKSDQMRPLFRGGARGTNVRRNRIGRSDFEAIVVRVPPLRAQRRIAAAERAIEKTGEQIERLAKLKAALLAHALDARGNETR